MAWRIFKQTLAAVFMLLIIGISLTVVYAHHRGAKFLSVQSGSMVPAYRKGDLVVVARVPAPSLKVGDVVTFINPKQKNKTITHRLVAVPIANVHGEYVTKGDANRAKDPPIMDSSILGKVSLSVPYAGYWADFIRRPLGLALVIYLPAIFVVFSELRRLAAYYKSQEIYTLPWRRRQRRVVSAIAKVLPLMILVPVLHNIPVRAALRSTVSMNDNAFSLRALPPTCPASGNSTTIIVTASGSGNISIGNSNNQTATTGNATSTSGGNATSGNATNCNSTNINVTIH